MKYLQIGKTTVKYDLQHCDRKKTIELLIDLNKGFTVKVPKGMSDEDIIRNLHRKEKWIINNLDKMADIIKYESKKEYLSGEKFAVSGRRYSLKVIKDKNIKLPTLEFSKGKFIAKIPITINEKDNHKLLRPLFIRFYQKKAEDVINKRVKKYLPYFDIEPKKIRIVSLKDKWGSCSKNNEIRYNWRIIMAKMSIIDYVVIHELAHMKHKDHSKEYWNEIKRIMPDYEKRKSWLRVKGELLRL